jgi:hypothetical protein
VTHAELVERAERWLRGTMRCGVVIAESGSIWCREIPDAIGWKNNHSILVECKTSRADFRADSEKPSRLTGGPGCCRFYMAREGVLDPLALPEGWGLVAIGGGASARARTLVHPRHREHDVRDEMGLLLSELRKVHCLRNGHNLRESRATRRIGALLAQETAP